MHVSANAESVVEGVKVTSEAQLVRGTLGGDALLSVSYSSSSSDLPVIRWQLRRDKEKPITVVQSIGTGVIGNLRPEYRDRVLVFENGSLLLHHLQLSDEGVYEVEISITDDTFTGEHYVNLTVDVPVSKPYVQMIASSVLEFNEHFHLHCSHDNGTKPSYGWQKGGKVLTNDTRLLLSRDQKVLTILRVLISDDDIYACTVDNPIGSKKSVPVRLTVYRRSSLYIILATGAIFLLITLVTVCACWKPSKKKRHSAILRSPVYQEEYDSGHDVDVVPKPLTVGRRSPMPLYVLSEDETLQREEDQSNYPISQSQVKRPQTYITSFPPPAFSPESHAHSFRRYQRSPSPLAYPLPHRPEALSPVFHPLSRSAPQSPASSPPVGAPSRRFRPPVGVPSLRLPVEPADLSEDHSSTEDHPAAQP
ncbi:hepatic and glial cell adhesion molecule a [Aplochiton taeniatus]